LYEKILPEDMRTVGSEVDLLSELQANLERKRMKIIFFKNLMA
jgi:hypothetical protein